MTMTRFQKESSLSKTIIQGHPFLNCQMEQLFPVPGLLNQILR